MSAEYRIGEKFQIVVRDRSFGGKERVALEVDGNTGRLSVIGPDGQLRDLLELVKEIAEDSEDDEEGNSWLLRFVGMDAGTFKLGIEDRFTGPINMPDGGVGLADAVEQALNETFGGGKERFIVDDSLIGEAALIVHCAPKVEQPFQTDVNDLTPESGVDSEQLVELGELVDGGTYTLTFDGHTTHAIAYDGVDLFVQNVLEGLESIGEGNVEVVGTSPVYNVKFVGALGEREVPVLQIDGGGLTNGEPRVTETKKGRDPGIPEIQGTAYTAE